MPSAFGTQTNPELLGSGYGQNSDIKLESEFQRNAAFVSLIKFAETSIFIIILLHFSGVTNGILFPPVLDGKLAVESDMARKLWFPIYGLVLLLVLKNILHVIRIAVFNPLLILCVLWAGLSFMWSIDPALSMRRAVALLMTTVAGLVLAARYDWNGMLQRLAFAFLIMAVVSCLYTLAKPDYGIMSQIHVGAWSGPWEEKNYFGAQMTKGFIACISALALKPSRLWLWGPGALFCLAMVVMSTSKTALLIALFSLLAYGAIWTFRKFPLLRYPLAYFIIGGIALFSILMWSIPDEMFALIGKDRTFTGRTDIWAELIRSIKLQPWLGYGYGAFWMDELGPSYSLRTILQWGVPTAHNGWFETWLSTGFVGVALFSVMFIMVLFLAFDRIKRGGHEVYWVVLSTLMFLMLSMSESTILQQNDLSWLMFVATTAKLFSLERPFWRNKYSLPYMMNNNEDFIPESAKEKRGNRGTGRAPSHRPARGA